MACTITPFVTGMQDDAELRGSTCVRDYLIEGEPTASDLPVIGQPWTAQDDWPGVEFRVTKYGRVGTVRNSGGVWVDVLRVHGSTNMQPVNASRTLSGQVEKEMQGGDQLQITADMIGARRAEDADCGKLWYPADKRTHQFVPGEYVYDRYGVRYPKAGYVAWPLMNTDVTPNVPYTAEELCWVKTPDGVNARLGQWIYSNAYNRIKQDLDDDGDELVWSVRTGSTGTKDLTNCPCTTPDVTDTDITISMIGKSFWMPMYSVAYYVRTDRYYMQNVPHYPNNGLVTDWGPLDGRKYGPMVYSGQPSVSGDWRIVNQSISGMYDTDGSHMLKIVRSFIRVPYVFSNCIWNPHIWPEWTNEDWP